MKQRRKSMGKKIVILSVIGTIITGGIGVNLYADQRLKNYYQMPEKLSQLVDKQQSEFKMGVLSGDAQWTYRLRPDPCQPNKEIILKGVDHIQRSWKGYDITSRINLDIKGKDFQEYKKILGGKDLFTVNSNLNWLGTVNMKIQSPALEKNEGHDQIVWQGGDGAITFRMQDGEYIMTNANVQFPGFVAQDKNSYLKFEGIRFQTDQSVSGEALRSGQSEFSLQRMVIRSHKLSSLNISNIDLDQLSLKTKLDVQDKLSAIQLRWKLQQMQVNHQNFNNINFNFDINDMDTLALKEFVKIVNQQPRVCDSQQQNAQETVLENQMLAIFRPGFSFTSNDNNIKLGQGKATLNVRGKFKQNQIKNIQDAKSELSQVVEYQADMKLDKQFLQNSIRLTNPSSQSLSPQETEQVMIQIAQKMHGRVRGNQVEVGISYRDGKSMYY